MQMSLADERPGEVTPVDGNRADDEIRAALAAADDPAASAVERAEMLMEIAVGLQRRPRDAGEIEAAVGLYDRALALCPDDAPLLSARIAARRGTALMARPGGGAESLAAARAAFEAATPVLAKAGLPEELAEAEMNLGLAVQALAGQGRARITDAIAAYQRALRTFDRTRFPQEFAILQNNLATAFLSMPFTDARARMREALAVQAFEEGLKVVTLVDHPVEYAMLQNNLGNALQYASSSHALENNLRAVEAYDEALKCAGARRCRSNTPTPSPTGRTASGTCRTTRRTRPPATAATCSRRATPTARPAISSSAAARPKRRASSPRPANRSSASFSRLARTGRTRPATGT